MRVRSGVQRGFSRSSDRIGASEAFFQVVRTAMGETTYTIPIDGWAFIEGCGWGGSPRPNEGNPGGGGAGEDTLVPVRKGEVLTIRQGLTADNNIYQSTTVLRAGVIILQAANGFAASAGAVGAPGQGKYPGNGRIGGGRLATVPNRSDVVGIGLSCLINPPAGRGIPATVISVFTTEQAAIDFANGLYSGSWVRT